MYDYEAHDKLDKLDARLDDLERKIDAIAKAVDAKIFTPTGNVGLPRSARIRAKPWGIQF